MPDILVLALDDSSGFELEAAAKRQGLRTRTAYNVGTAVEWLSTLSFDGLLLDVRVPIRDQQSLAGSLWARNPLALYLVYDLSGGQGHEARLFGAEVFRSLETLEARLGKIERAVASQQASESLAILVVEDLDSPRDIICLYIESLGYAQVIGVQSAQEALKRLHAEPDKFMCIVSDIKMPLMDGEQLVAAVRADAKLAHLPIIMLTAYGTVDCLFDCLKAGASGFLVKPPRKKELGAELQRARRIMAHNLDPRLTTAEDADRIHDLLVDKGLMG